MSQQGSGACTARCAGARRRAARAAWLPSRPRASAHGRWRCASPRAAAAAARAAAAALVAVLHQHLRARRALILLRVSMQICMVTR